MSINIHRKTNMFDMLMICFVFFKKIKENLFYRDKKIKVNEEKLVNESYYKSKKISWSTSKINNNT